MMRFRLAVMVGLLLAGLSGGAGAAPILAQNTTDVTLTAAPTLTALGIAVAPLGSTTVVVRGGLPVASFPITGGTANTDGSLLIQHDGSGLRFSKGSVLVSIGNFLVDTKQALISGNVGVGSTTLGTASVPLFKIGSGLSLTLSSAAAGLLNAQFGTKAFTDATLIGSAVTNPVVASVPEPASLALLALAVLGLLAVRSGRRDAVRVA